MYHLPSKKSVNGTTHRPARPPKPPNQSSKTVLVSVHVGPPQPENKSIIVDGIGITG